MSDVQHDEPALLELKEEIGGEIGAYDPTKKKKKKEARMFEDEEPVPVKEVAPAEGAVDSAFLGLKKKKKKKPVEGESLEEENGDAEDEANGAELEAEDDEPAEGIELRTDRDYKYDELLGRVFNNLRENNPELSAERRRTIMRPPQVLREGTKKTVFVNFMDLCKTFFDLFCACIGGAQRELRSDITTTPADNRPGLRKAEPERSRNENCVLSPSLPS